MNVSKVISLITLTIEIPRIFVPWISTKVERYYLHKKKPDKHLFNFPDFFLTAGTSQSNSGFNHSGTSFKYVKRSKISSGHR